LLAGVVTLTAWIFLRIQYNKRYKQRLNLFQWIKQEWGAWNKNQRLTSIILTVIALIIFGCLFPLNRLPENSLNRGVNCDEQTIYPDAAVKILTFQPTFGETIFNMIAGPYWWYGYPFDIISAIPLIIPRIIYGNDFSSHFALNILLLRQFVSVLPMLIALIILVYLVTEFKSPLPSAGLFIFFLSLPGVVLNNIRFWHPDGIIVLLTALTIFYLKRDDLQFGKHFYYAAVCCSLSASIKIWGVFFFVAVGGYIVAGIIRKKVSGKKGLLAGLYFILVMVLVFVMFNPNWLAPWLARNNIESILDQQNKIFFGFEGKNEPEVYKTGLANWLTFSSLYFMNRPYFYLPGCCLFGAFWDPGFI